MMPSSTTSLQVAQGLHRRQQSTPTAFFDAKAQASATIQPNAVQQHYAQAPGHHRRGLSLDVRRPLPTQMAARQEYRMSMNAHMGLTASPQHHMLQEAQQQQRQPIQACPGPQHTNLYDTYQVSPQESSFAQRFDPSGGFHPNLMQFGGAFGGQMNIMIPKDQGAYINNVSGSKEFEMFSTDSTQSTPTFINFPESPLGPGWVSEGDVSSSSSSRKHSRRISNGIVDRVAKYDIMGIEDLQRPVTPTSLNGNDYLPPTPLGTPHERAPKQEARVSRFLDNYDESMIETIKPNRKRQTQTAQDIFNDVQPQADQGVSTMGGAAQGPSSAPDHQGFPRAQQQQQQQHMQIPDYMNMSVIKDEFHRMEARYDDGMPGGSAMLQSASNFAHHMAVPVNARHLEQAMAAFEGSSQAGQLHSDDLSETDSPARASRHRRTESMASIASAASIANINIEETRTETGVTMEEIAQFIQSPDTTDGKWTCLFEECGKQFGRKENIKSHVQTHLNDRQYQCPTCHKCFVRQHDLKRHAKIHTGIKPYPCDCGNSFARHDALTRHRQRGMCVGAFDGVVRKVVKRGRPKKNRPDMDTRLEKSTKTRRKNMSISSVSSQSGYSDFDSSSVVDSSDIDHDMLDDMLDIGLEPKTEKLSSLSSAPMPGSASRTAIEYAPSPAVSAHSFVAADAVMEKVPPLESPDTSGRSQNNTPPDMSQSSSPPARFFDLDHGAGPATEGLSTMTSAGMMMGSATMSGALPMGIGEQDDDLLLQFTNDDGLVQLERDPMMMMTKFDEEFDSTIGMFTNNEDVFFGSA